MGLDGICQPFLASFMASLMIRLLVLFLLWPAGAAPGPVPNIAIVIAVDLNGNGRDASVADAAHSDTAQRMLSFRVRPFGRSNADAFGVDIVVDTYGADAGRMNWWNPIGGPGRVRVSSVALMLDD
jgi:hypothetical protein